MSSAPQSWNANLYDQAHSFVWKAAASLLDLLDPKAGEWILDLGCGTAHLTAQIAAAGATVVGLDSSPEMIENGHQLYPQIQLEVGDARTFAFDEPFDAVFSNAALHWIKEPETVVQRIRSALKPGGRFVAEFGGKGNVQQIVAALERQASLFDVQDLQIPWYYPSISEYAGVLEDHGFEVTFVTLFDRPTPLEGEDGMRKWLEMFALHWLDQIASEKKGAFLAAVEQDLRPALYRDGTWYADYRRLRVVAHI